MPPHVARPERNQFNTHATIGVSVAFLPLAAEMFSERRGSLINPKTSEMTDFLVHEILVVYLGCDYGIIFRRLSWYIS